MMFRLPLLALLLLAALIAPTRASAEDGYDLWLRYRPVEAAWQSRYAPAATELVGASGSATLEAAGAELQRGLSGLHGQPLPTAVGVTRDGAILIGTPRSSPLVAGLNLPLERLGAEGYLIRSVRIGGHSATLIAANSDVGALYGAFRLLRLIQTRQPIDRLDLSDAPAVERRVPSSRSGSACVGGPTSSTRSVPSSGPTWSTVGWRSTARPGW